MKRFFLYVNEHVPLLSGTMGDAPQGLGFAGGVTMSMTVVTRGTRVGNKVAFDSTKAVHITL
jgi:hypothetical protein